MTNSTSEREQRLRGIRERSESRKRVAGKFQWAQVSTQEWADIDFLLSLLDSEAVSGDTDYKRLAREMAMIVDVGTSDDPGTALLKLRKVQHDAAISMRDLCVEKVKKKAASYQADVDRLGAALKYRERMAYTASALREVANELQSLTLEQE